MGTKHLYWILTGPLFAVRQQQHLEDGADRGTGMHFLCLELKSRKDSSKLTQIYGMCFTSMESLLTTGKHLYTFLCLTQLLKVSTSAALWKYGSTKRSRDCFNRVYSASLRGTALIKNEFNDKQMSSLQSWIVNLFQNSIYSPEVSATWLDLSKMLSENSNFSRDLRFIIPS
jgi:hypothetical protein